MALDRPARAGVRWAPESQWHVTLRFFARVDPDALVAALDRAEWPESVVAVAGPRPAVLRRGGVWVLPVAGLHSLAGAVARAVAALGSPAEGDRRPFNGHLTLARSRRPGQLRDLPAPDLSVRWRVEQVYAYRSELLPAGAVHHVIGRWPLPGA